MSLVGEGKVRDCILAYLTLPYLTLPYLSYSYSSFIHSRLDGQSGKFSIEGDGDCNLSERNERSGEAKRRLEVEV